jgi:streptogramin lyase
MIIQNKQGHTADCRTSRRGQWPRFALRIACVMAVWTLWFAFAPAELQSADPVSPFLQQYDLPEKPQNIVVESPGRLWFTLPESNQIGSLIISETVTLQLYPVPTANSRPYDLAYAAGSIWFTQRTGNQLGRFLVAESRFEAFPMPTANSEPTGIAVAPDGAVWFAQRTGNQIGRFDPRTNQFDEYRYETPNAHFEKIAVADAGTVWVTAPNLHQVVRLQREGATARFFAQSTLPYRQPMGLVLAGDQQLWVTAAESNAILRYTPGTLTLWTPYPLPTRNGTPTMLAFRALDERWEFWFTENATGTIGRLLVTPEGSQLDVRSQPLPVADSQPWGLAVDAQGQVWVAATGSKQIMAWQPPYFEPELESYQAFVPLVLRDPCFQGRMATPFGLQLYGATGRASRHHPLLVESKAHWVRAEIQWADIEPVNLEPAQFSWQRADGAVGAALDGCHRLVLTIIINPYWAATSPSGPINQVGLDEFAEFVGAVVERYDGDGQADAAGSPVVHYFEFYNEPDAAWGHFGQQYAEMLAAVYPVVKAANPQAQVVFGGLAYDAFLEEGGWFVRTFLDDVLAAGGGAHFDYMNFHYYPAFAGRWTTTQGPGLKEKVEAIRTKLNEYGVEKPILITETGWSNINNGTDEIQSRYVVELFTQSIAAGVTATFWWTLIDINGWEMGLVTNTTPPVKKPAFSVYQIMVEELQYAQYLPTLPQPETSNPAVEVYSFRDHATGQHLYIAWLNPISSEGTAELLFPASAVSVRALDGPRHTIDDGADQMQDGRVTVAVGAPVYIRVLGE